MRTRSLRNLLAISVLLLVMAVVLLFIGSTIFAGQIVYLNGDGNDDYANSLIVEEPDGAVLLEYVPNEIIVKFRENVADAIEMTLVEVASGSELELPNSLDMLNNKYRLRNVKALFKDFKKKRQWTKQLPKKDKALLTRKERHILSRLKRAPKNVKVPDLGRIYKIQVELEKGQSLQEAVKAYRGNPYVEYAELNYIVSIDLTPNDPLYPLQWPLNNTGQVYPESGNHNTPQGIPDCDIDAPEAWDINTGRSEVIIAVVDTGVDFNHRDLRGNMWTDSIGRYGYNFVNDDPYPMDDHGHGTHCSGIIAAEGNNAFHITGVCWDAKIMALKSLGANGEGDYADAIEAFYYAVENGADIISNSWGKDHYSGAMQDAIDYAYSQGVIVVASAGNDYASVPHYPACNEHVIAVASTNSNEQKAPSSNYGQWVDIVAPGVDILSLRADGTSMGTVHDDYTTVASGTSMACPNVAGVLGLLLSHHPGISLRGMTTRLLATADDISKQNPSYKGLLGTGRVNAFKAIRNSFKGLIKLDSDCYACSDVVHMEVLDFDVMGQGTLNVMVTTDGGDSETVSLTADVNDTWVFTGGIITADGNVVFEDGILQVLHGQIITATYSDANYGTGNPGMAEATATVDCQPPAIFNVKVTDITSTGGRVTFDTDEPTTGRVRCGTTRGGPYTIVADDTGFSPHQSVYVGGLISETTYYFELDAADAMGNEITGSNEGQCYMFTTGPTPAGLHVPKDYPTIQDAIDAAVHGDMIWVADGTHTGQGNRDIDFEGKAITLRSENGPEHCTIDCQGSDTDPHCGFYFHNGEGPNSVLEGLTITNGVGPKFCREDPDFGYICITIGGGISCDGTSPTITNCVITGNRTEGDGAGISCNDASPTITDCIITGNQAGSEGGGIICGYFNTSSDCVISNCIITGNSAHIGGGIFCNSGHQTIIDCIVTANTANDYGAGICLWQDSAALIKNCIIKDNIGKYRGGGITAVGSAPTITNCIITANRDFSSPGGIFGGGGICSHGASGTITNCTITGNSSTGMGGGAHFHSAADPRVKVTDCIFWGNQAPEGPQIRKYKSSAFITYCDVQGGWWDGLHGNIDVEPCFADPNNGDYHLKSQAGRWDANEGRWTKDDVTSPCIDAGDPMSPISLEPFPNGGIINMGAYGGTAEASKSYFGEPVCETIVAGDINGDCVVNFFDFAIMAFHWLEER